MEMKENLDNAFYQNNIKPSTVDKAAVSPIDSIDKIESCDGIMDNNQNDTLNENVKNVSKQEIVNSTNILPSNNNLSFNVPPNELSYNSSLVDVGKSEQANTDKQINGFVNEMNTINNGKSKRNDDQLNEISSIESNEKITKKICNNITKTTETNLIDKQNGNPGSSNSSINVSTASSTIKENCNNSLDLSDNTETESNSEQFESEDDDLTEDENSWDCSVCTFRNIPEAFKCQMCDVRKGMSTRKPRVNPKLLAQQVAKQQEQIQKEAIKAKEKGSTPKEKSKNILENKRKTQDLEPMSPTSSTCSSKSIKRERKDKTCVKEENGVFDKKLAKGNFIFKLKDVDRNSGVTNSITVNNVTVVITEFQLKKSPEDTDTNNKMKNGKKASSNKGNLR